MLLKANVTHLENSECENCYKHFRLDPNKQLCAGDREGRHDTCKGDSGGPLMRICKYKRKKSFVQYGIVACGGMACSATRALPGIYTNIVNYLPWITNNIIN